MRKILHGTHWDNFSMTQKYFFLDGLSRSGNTLFASIMNQNKDVAVTPNSITVDMMWKLNGLKDTESFKNFPDTNSFNSVMENVLPNYYKTWKHKNIIDRSPWGLTGNLEMLKKHLKNKIKIIVLVRDVSQVLASLIKISNDNPYFFLNKVSNNVDEKCNFLVNKGQLSIQLKSIRNLLKDNNRKYAHFVEYDDLVNNYKDTIDEVYDFLDIPKFKHRFTNMNQLKINGVSYDDSVFGGDLHTIRTDSVSKNKYKINDILPNKIIEQYNNYNIWR